MSDEHFSVDGTMIEAWASHKSLVRRDDNNKEDPPEEPGSRNAEVDFKAERRCYDTHASTTDQDARLYKKAKYGESKLHHLTHIVSENRNGLVVDVETTTAIGHAERDAAEKIAARTLTPGATLGADKGYEAKGHIEALQELGIVPHVAAKNKSSAVPEETQQSEGYAISLRKRKRIEECFGWAKTVGGFRKTRFIGTAKVQAQALLVFAAYNLTRIMQLCGWKTQNLAL